MVDKHLDSLDIQSRQLADIPNFPQISFPEIATPDAITKIKDTTVLESSWTPFYNTLKGIWKDLIKPNFLFFFILIIVILIVVYRYIHNTPKKPQEKKLDPLQPFQMYQNQYKNHDLYLRTQNMTKH